MGKLKTLLTNKALLLIVLLGGTLRFFRLADFPPSLNWDEVSHAINAFSILSTGKDEWGMSFPLIFRAFGDFKLPLYIYLTVIPVKIFGLTPFATRFISALAGILAIPGIYLLSNQVFTAKRHSESRTDQPMADTTDRIFALTPGHYAALLLALSPWHFFISRPALEANLGLTLFIFGLYFLLRSLREKKSLLPASFLLALTLHTYNSYRVVTPLLILAFLLIFRSKHKPKALILPALVFAASFALVVFQTFTGSGTARYQKLAILTENAVFQIGEKRQLSTLPSPLPRLLYNRPIYFAKQFAGNYLGYFSPSFLYQNQGAQRQFAIPGENLLTPAVSVLLLIGLLFVFKKISSPYSQFLISLLLFAPTAAALTNDPPQALRPTTMIPPLILISSFGLYRLLKLKKLKALPLLLIFLTFVSFGLFLNNYFKQYPKKYSDSWQFGYQQAIEYVASHQSEYPRVFITKRYGEPHIFYAFYTKLPAKALQPGGDNVRFNKSDWYWTDRIGQVYFINHWLIPHDLPVSQLPLESGGALPTADSLIVTAPSELPSNTNVLKRIYFLDGTEALVIAKFN